MKIIIGGKGKLAHVFCKFFEEKGCVVHFYSADNTFLENPPLNYFDICFYSGSGREFNSVLSYCEFYDIPLCIVSSNVCASVWADIPVIDAKMLALPQLELLKILSVMSVVFSGFNTMVYESHQASKKSIPAYANSISQIFNNCEIKSIRDIKTQARLGVPEEFLDGHAYHIVKMSGDGMEIEIKTKIHGRDVYAIGALELARAVVENRDNLINRVYRAEEILDKRGDYNVEIV